MPKGGLCEAVYCKHPIEFHRYRESLSNCISCGCQGYTGYEFMEPPTGRRYYYGLLSPESRESEAMPESPVNSNEVRTTSSTGGQKGVKPERYGLIPIGPLATVARLYGFGANKYESHNWRKGYEWSKSYDALSRHLTQFWNGEDIDEETGLPHMAAVVFHAFALLEFMERFPEFDDRYKPMEAEKPTEPAAAPPVDETLVESDESLETREIFRLIDVEAAKQYHILNPNAPRSWYSLQDTHPDTATNIRNIAMFKMIRDMMTGTTEKEANLA